MMRIQAKPQSRHEAIRLQHANGPNLDNSHRRIRGGMMNTLKTLASAAVSIIAVSNVVSATSPYTFCGPHDKMVGNLTGKPHYEKKISVAIDENNGALLELFVSRSGRKSYTILWSLPGNPSGSETCILSAGDSFSPVGDKVGEGS